MRPKRKWNNALWWPLNFEFIYIRSQLSDKLLFTLPLRSHSISTSFNGLLDPSKHRYRYSASNRWNYVDNLSGSAAICIWSLKAAILGFTTLRFGRTSVFPQIRMDCWTPTPQKLVKPLEFCWYLVCNRICMHLTFSGRHLGLSISDLVVSALRVWMLNLKNMSLTVALSLILCMETEIQAYEVQ